MEQIDVASGKFNMVTTEAEFTGLESELSFLQVRSTITLQETIRQVKAEICEDLKQIAHTRLESIARAENPYSLMQVFGRGHQVTRNGAMVYVTRCQAADVLPRTHTNCTNEIPALLNRTNVFVDPISFVIKAAAAMVRCNDIAPPRWRLNGRWYCAFLEIRDRAEPGRIPMKPIAIEPWFGQEYLQSCAVGGVRALPGEPGDAARILGRECRESLQQPGWRTVGLRSARPGL
jgi:hypothetical protein